MVTVTRSSVSLDDVVASATRYSQLQWCDGFLYWLEQRPQQKGRGVIVRWDSMRQIKCDLTPDDISVRSKVNEYGGGDYLATSDGVFFVNAVDQQIYLQDNSGVHVITAQSNYRFADFSYDAKYKRLFAVAEIHHENVSTQALMSIDSRKILHLLHDSADFYAAPRFDSSTNRLCWLQWCLPSMPWDNAALYCAVVHEHELADVEAVVKDESVAVLAPLFDQKGQLWWCDDRDGYWRVRCERQPEYAHSPAQQDCGVAAWSLGQQPFVHLKKGDIAFYYFQNGNVYLQHAGFSHAFAAISSQVATNGHDVFCFAAQPDQGMALYRISADGAKEKLTFSSSFEPVHLAQTCSTNVTQGAVPVPYYLYLPVMSALENKSPLIVFIHSGPTGMADCSLNLVYQYFLQQGFAIADINYRGSYGLGRAFRQSLLGHWGDYDVHDTLQVITELTTHPQIDATRIYLRGNSAGGLTVLHALARQSALFRAAALRYPVVDLLRLQACSHRFEQGYLAQLIGASSIDDERWLTASSLSVLHAVQTPVLVCQGDQDPVVPLDQINALAVKSQNRILILQGEGHGFRRADALKTALQAELDWFTLHK